MRDDLNLVIPPSTRVTAQRNPTNIIRGNEERGNAMHEEGGQRRIRQRGGTGLLSHQRNQRHLGSKWKSVDIHLSQNGSGVLLLLCRRPGGMFMSTNAEDQLCNAGPR